MTLITDFRYINEKNTIIDQYQRNQLVGGLIFSRWAKKLNYVYKTL